MGRANPHDVLAMSITLQLQHQDELEGLIAAQQSPGSPDYHRWLSPQEFTARFAPPVKKYDALADWLERQGFGVRRWENRLRIDFAGDVTRVERTFVVRMNYYRHWSGTRVANENAPLLPVQFADRVGFVRINTFPLARPLIKLVDHSGLLVTTVAPRDLQVAYNATPVLGTGIDGSGQTIAVVARSDYATSDISRFLQQFGAASQQQPIKVFPAGNPGLGAPNGVCKNSSDPNCVPGELGEVLLDVEWANAMAPAATVLVDIAGPCAGCDADIDQSFFDIVNYHPEAKIISMSFGACELLDQADHALFGPMYLQAASQGQTVLVATGDNGADDCQLGPGRPGHPVAPSVNVLASDPNVTAVGGTALDPGFDASGNATGRVSERVWNDTYGASGGGASTIVRKPAYQVAPGVPADGFRDVPDVALLASPGTCGYISVIEGQVVVIGGTSAATPSWAGIVALLNQTVHATGSGALNQRLYALARKQYQGAAAGPFHDIVVGNNSFNGVTGFSAGVGYDLASGLGTPDVDLLAAAFGTSECAGDCSGDGIVTVNDIITAVRIMLGLEPLSACPAADVNGDGTVTIDELLDAVNRSLNGC
ncbi:MAG: protease pro-enzyme activation domain-containing protein [Candidatus Binatia bacterium]